MNNPLPADRPEVIYSVRGGVANMEILYVKFDAHKGIVRDTCVCLVDFRMAERWVTWHQQHGIPSGEFVINRPHAVRRAQQLAYEAAQSEPA